ncbi:monocarboxylate transporter 6-like [Chrysoperla carnea]|uniref:monocarboxylate transporter 6-like n=1 Tax=Chrysoperla carnea TaxID=189513 RepID=UPI001D0988E9|nr:monocarboxylate transporter 6-like [Chrysoperla carnea]
MTNINMELKSNSKRSEKLTYTWEAPDGGWGYMVALGFVLMFSFTMSTFVCFGLVYGKFLKERGDEITSTTYIHGVFGVTFSFMGLLTNRLLSYYSLRLIGIIGSIIYFSGAFLSIFVQNVSQLVFTFGFLQGVGYGLMVPVVFTAFNQYFVKKRSLVNSISQGMITALTLTYPVITQYLVENFGQRGTAAIFAAGSLNAFFAVVLIQPVEKHMVKKVQDSEAPNLKTEFKQISITNEKNNEKHQESITFLQVIVDTLDLTLLCDLKFVNLIVGCALAYVTDICLINLTPLLLLNRGFSSQTTAFILTLVVCGDFVSRIIQTIFNVFITVKSRYLVLLGLISAGIMRLVFALDEDLMVAAIAIIAVGFFRSWIHVPLPLAIAESCSSKRFPAAYGLYMITTGIFNILLPILLAVISQTDTTTVIILAALILIGGISWTIEIMWLKGCQVKNNDIK